jgi:hypothetical protein
MKDLKLRGFDKISKKMVYFERFSQIPSNWKEVFGELMLFCCLHDCEGKEVWEGDAVEVDRMDSFSRSDTGIVVYGNGAYGFYSFVGKRWVSIFDWPLKRVIGNIYEHPELEGK